MSENKKQAATTVARQHIMEAMLSVLRQQGANALTLDAVAREAGISKGGLLHHYPDKNTLLESLTRFLIEQFNQRVEMQYEREEVTQGRWLRAYLRVSFEADDSTYDLGGIITLLAQNQTAIQLAHVDSQRWIERFTSDGVSVVRAELLKRVADSQWVEQLMMPSPRGQQELLNEALSLVDS